MPMIANATRLGIVVAIFSVGSNVKAATDIDGTWVGSTHCSGVAVKYEFRVAGFKGVVRQVSHLPDGVDSKDYKVFIPVRDDFENQTAEFRIDDGRQQGDWMALVSNGKMQVNDGSRMEDCAPFTLSLRAPATDEMYANPAAPDSPLYEAPAAKKPPLTMTEAVVAGLAVVIAAEAVMNSAKPKATTGEMTVSEERCKELLSEVEYCPAKGIGYDEHAASCWGACGYIASFDFGKPSCRSGERWTNLLEARQDLCYRPQD